MHKALAIWFNACLLVVALAMLSGCFPYRAQVLPEYDAAIIPDDNLQAKTGHLAITVCSWNNRPYIVIDTEVLMSRDSEGIIRHEQKHVSQVNAFRGGCWAFLKRFSRDSVFKAEKEYEAYCTQGNYLITRNRDPESVWESIKNTMQTRYGVKDPKNCIYESEEEG